MKDPSWYCNFVLPACSELGFLKLLITYLFHWFIIVKIYRSTLFFSVSSYHNQCENALLFGCLFWDTFVSLSYTVRCVPILYHSWYTNLLRIYSIVIRTWYIYIIQRIMRLLKLNIETSCMMIISDLLLLLKQRVKTEAWTTWHQGRSSLDSKSWEWSHISITIWCFNWWESEKWEDWLGLMFLMNLYKKSF